MHTPRRGRKTRAPGWLRLSLGVLGASSASVAGSLTWMTVTSWNAVAVGPTGYLTMWGLAYGPIYAAMAVGVAVVAIAVMSTLVVGDNYKKLEASFSRYVGAVFQEDREKNIDFVADAVSLIKERVAAYGNVTATARHFSIGSLFRSKWKLYTGSIQFKEYVASSRQFLDHLRKSVEKEVVHNAYPKAAITQLSEELSIVVLRGLSDVYNITLPGEEERFVAEVACTIKQGRQTELSDDVMYMCVSYKHQRTSDGGRILKRCTRSNSRMRCTCQDVPEYEGRKDMGMLDSDWREVYREAKRCALMAGVQKISLWVDKQVYHDDYSWIALGLVPYLVFPTIRSTANGTEADRLWLRLEQACAKIGPGITNDWSDDVDMLQHLVVTRTPIESFLTISELVRGRGCDRYHDPSRTTFMADLERLRTWADGIVRAGRASVILHTPMPDIAWYGSGRRDCSHLSIYDDDLEDVNLVKDYKRALSVEETPGDEVWRIEDLLLEGRAVEVESDFVEKLKGATIVTQVDTELNSVKTFLVVTLTMGGCMASRVRVSYGHGKVEGHVLSSCKDSRSRDEIAAHLEQRRREENRAFRTLIDFNWR